MNQASRLWVVGALAFASIVAAPALGENRSTPALDALVRALNAITDYQVRGIVHETTDDGAHVQDRTYDFRWKRPNYERIEIIAGPGKGEGASWHGGPTVRGHQGGFLSGIHMNVSIHDPRATSLRGDTIETAAFTWQAEHLLNTPGRLSEAPGPVIDGAPTTAVTLQVTDSKANGNVSRDVLYIGKEKHLPLRREQFAGTTLVKTEHFVDIKVDNGFSVDDLR